MQQAFGWALEDGIMISTVLHTYMDRRLTTNIVGQLSTNGIQHNTDGFLIVTNRYRRASKTNATKGNSRLNHYSAIIGRFGAS
jgi:hypothetical protein